MKKAFVLFLGLIMTVFSFTGCNKESDDPSNLINAGGTKAEIKNLAMYLKTQSTNGYQYYVELVGDGISFNADGAFRGSGSYLQFMVVSPSVDGITSGDYTFDSDVTYSAFEYFSAYHCMDWTDLGAGNNGYITSGILSVTRDDHNYEISFSGVDTDGKKVSAHYKGSSIFYDWRATKSSSAPAK